MKDGNHFYLTGDELKNVFGRINRALKDIIDLRMMEYYRRRYEEKGEISL